MLDHCHRALRLTPRHVTLPSSHGHATADAGPLPSGGGASRPTDHWHRWVVNQWNLILLLASLSIPAGAAAQSAATPKPTSQSSETSAEKAIRKTPQLVAPVDKSVRKSPPPAAASTDKVPRTSPPSPATQSARTDQITPPVATQAEKSLRTSPPPLPPYASAVAVALQSKEVAWTTRYRTELSNLVKLKPEPLVVDLEIGSDGAIRGERLIISSGRPEIDDLGRTFLLTADPLPEPDASWLHAANLARCLVRLTCSTRQKQPALLPVVACLPPGQPFGQVSAPLSELRGQGDAAAHLFSGWLKETAGDAAAALWAYRQSRRAAPHWDLAARSLGLALVKAQHVPQAIPHLKDYVEAQTGAEDAFAFAREIRRYEEAEAKRLAEINRVRDRLSKEEIISGVRKGYALLEPCLKQARRQRYLQVGSDTLLLTWTIQKDGSPSRVRLEGPPTLLMTEHAECLERAATRWRFPRYSAGSEITAMRVPIKVRGSLPLPPPKEQPTTAPPPPEPLAEPLFSECERSEEDIQDHIRSRLPRLQTCVLGERQRTPKAALPAQLLVSFVIDSDGPLRDVMVEHRAYRDGPLAKCVAEALTTSLPPTTGADCPAEFSLDLGRMARGP